MRIETLCAGHIRCWQDFSLPRIEKINVFIGQNGVGKTSILEMLWASHRGRTARGNRLSTFIQHDGNYSTKPFIRMEVSRQSDGEKLTNDLRLILNSDGTTNQCLVDEEKVSRTAFSYLIPMVLMQPGDVQLLLAGAEYRREILQRVAFQQDPTFLETYQQYERTLQQRNALLKQRKQGKYFQTNELQVWDTQLSEYAIKVRAILASIFQKVGPRSAEILTELFPKITVQPKIIFSDNDVALSTQEIDSFLQSDTPDRFRKNLQKTFEKDCRNGYTSLGPQRLDWNLFFDGLQAKFGASQGQLRSAALAIRMAQAVEIESSSGEAPIVLVDDLAGELDDIRGSFLLEWLGNRDLQVWLTGTSMKTLPPAIHKFDLNCWKVEPNQLLSI